MGVGGGGLQILFYFNGNIFSEFICCLRGVQMLWGVCFCLLPTPLGKLLYASVGFELYCLKAWKVWVTQFMWDLWYTEMLSHMCFSLTASLPLINSAKNIFSSNPIQGCFYWQLLLSCPVDRGTRKTTIYLLWVLLLLVISLKLESM